MENTHITSLAGDLSAYFESRVDMLWCEQCKCLFQTMGTNYEYAQPVEVLP